MMNILISVNKEYIDKAQTMLFSLRRQVHEEITVYLINHSLSSEDIKISEDYLRKKCSITMQCINVKNTMFDQMTLGNQHFSIEMYYRILAQFLLPESIERVLWLDADIIVLKNISDFYHQSFDGKKYIVAPDRGVNNPKYKRELGLSEECTYFNSGVLLMNLECLRKETSEEIINETAKVIQARLVLPDQDLLNYLYHDDVKYVDWRVYNYQYQNGEIVNSQDLQKIAVFHYVGARKPWLYWGIDGNSKHYWRVRVQQGYWIEAIEAYWRQIKELTYVYINTIRELLW